MYLTDFEFNGKRLSDFGSIPCVINSSTGANEISMGADITWNTVKNNHSFNTSLVSSEYQDQYSLDAFEFCKNPCGDNQYYSDLEIRQIMRWLNREKFGKFKPIYKDGEVSDVYYVGSFNVKAISLGGECIGFSVTFQSNSPYGFGELCSYDYEDLEANEKIYIDCDSDRYGYLYPVVQIKCKQAGNVSFINSNTKERPTLSNCSNGEVVTFNGNTRIITSNKESSHEFLYKDFSNVFPKIFCDEDNAENEISCSLPCDLHIEFTPVRKIGVF